MESLSVVEARRFADARVLRRTFARRKDIASSDCRWHTPTGSVDVRIYRPQTLSSDTAAPALLYCHGGGMVVGSIETVDPHCRWYCAELNCVVISVGYRLAPEHQFPSGASDVVSVLKHLYEQAPALGIDSRRVAVVGESSGGTLVAVACHELSLQRSAMPCAQVLIYPAVDASTDWDSFERLGRDFFFTKTKFEWFMSRYLRNAADALDPRASPIRYESFAGLPPSLIITAGLDPLLDETLAYADRLKAAGVPVDYLCLEQWPHGFFYWAETEAAQTTMARSIAFIQDRFAAAAAT